MRRTESDGSRQMRIPVAFELDAPRMTGMRYLAAAGYGRLHGVGIGDVPMVWQKIQAVGCYLNLQTPICECNIQAQGC